MFQWFQLIQNQNLDLIQIIWYFIQFVPISSILLPHAFQWRIKELKFHRKKVIKSILFCEKFKEFLNSIEEKETEKVKEDKLMIVIIAIIMTSFTFFHFIPSLAPLATVISLCVLILVLSLFLLFLFVYISFYPFLVSRIQKIDKILIRKIIFYVCFSFLAIGLSASYYFVNKNFVQYLVMFVAFFMFSLPPVIIINEDVRKIVQENIKKKYRENYHFSPNIEIITTLQNLRRIRGKIADLFDEELMVILDNKGKKIVIPWDKIEAIKCL